MLNQCFLIHHFITANDASIPDGIHDDREVAMTLIQLKYFQTICKYNNITRASAELHVSQPSLSNAVKELEREFGVSLFTRRSRGLELRAATFWMKQISFWSRQSS